MLTAFFGLLQDRATLQAGPTRDQIIAEASAKAAQSASEAAWIGVLATALVGIVGIIVGAVISTRIARRAEGFAKASAEAAQKSADEATKANTHAETVHRESQAAEAARKSEQEAREKGQVSILASSLFYWDNGLADLTCAVANLSSLPDAIRGIELKESTTPNTTTGTCETKESVILNGPQPSLVRENPGHWPHEFPMSLAPVSTLAWKTRVRLPLADSFWQRLPLNEKQKYAFTLIIHCLRAPDQSVQVFLRANA
jgi:hypothetical protein